MKPLILLFSLASILLISCNTAYKTLETPDDVYYSSGRPQGDETVKNDEPLNRDMRMKSRDRRWREFDDWNYDPYRYGYTYSYYYNPYYFAYPVFGCYTCGFWGPAVIRNSTPRMTNLGSYYNTNTKVLNTKTGSVTNLSGVDRYNNSNSNRNIFRGSRSSGSDGIRTYSPSSTPSIRSSGSGAPVFRPRGN